jgi:hypothetical protein
MPSMIVSKMIFPTLKKAMFTATAVIALMQCTEEELVKPSAIATESEISAASASNHATVSSLTVTGANTTYTTLTDCKTCTYIVSPKEELIDGKILGFKPGNIICLNKGVNYGNIEIINVEGTIEKPITIATIGATSSVAAGQNPTADPY